jgi:hypothetical protein
MNQRKKKQQEGSCVPADAAGRHARVLKGNAHVPAPVKIVPVRATAARKNNILVSCPALKKQGRIFLCLIT